MNPEASKDLTFLLRRSIQLGRMLIQRHQSGLPSETERPHQDAVDEYDAMERFAELAAVVMQDLMSPVFRPYLKAHGLMSKIEDAEQARLAWEGRPCLL